MTEPEVELLIGRDGLLTEKAVHDLAEWYAAGKGDIEDFEAHLMMLRAHTVLLGSAQRGRRTFLSMERFGLLRLLYRAPDGRMLLSDVSRALNVSPTSISKLLSAMSNEGHVERVSHPEDKRRAWAQITDAGRRLMEQNMPRIRESTRSRWQGLTTEEKRMLVHLLAKLVMSVYSSRAESQLHRLESRAGAALDTRGAFSALEPAPR